MSAFYIASLKHTHKWDAHITFWAWFERGYTPVVGAHIGRYCYGEASRLNDGMDFIAVPVDAVEALQSPEPYYKPGARFYDQRGPVVDNTRANWNALIAASLADGRSHRPKPEPFKGKRRCFDFAEAA